MEAEAELFKALSDPTRLRLVTLLAVRGEVCVCVLAEALAEPEFKISRHLRVLRAAGVVAVRRAGAWMHYRLAAPRTRLEACLHGCLRECLQEDATVRADSARLASAACASKGVTVNA